MELILKSLNLDSNKFMKKYGGKSTFSPKEFSTSPYDLFYYNNKPEFLDIPNCSIHVDPGTIFQALNELQGWMTCVPCSPTPGLELIDLEAGDWVCIEKLLETTKDVTIFCAKALQDLSDDKYLASVHRVGKAERPRCSLVYEMRPNGAISQSVLNDMKKHCEIVQEKE